MRQVEIRRHTDNDGDVLTAEGVKAALQIGGRLEGRYEVVVSTGAQRATQTAACFLAAGCGGVARGVIVKTGLRSDDEDRWRRAYKEAGSGALDALREADPDFVDVECETLGAALRRVLESLDEDGTALVVGHSPTSEAAVFGLTGEVVEPLGKGEGALVTAEDGGWTVARLD